MPLPAANAVTLPMMAHKRDAKMSGRTSRPIRILSMPPWPSSPTTKQSIGLGGTTWAWHAGAATNGHERGLEAFGMWSQKSSKYDEANTRESWQRYFTSPPTEIGAGTIFQKADQAQFGWRALVGLPIEKVTEILRLAKLPLAQYDTERKEAAKRLGIRRVNARRHRRPDCAAA